MFKPLIELALSRTSTDDERSLLAPVLAAAIALDEEERTFGQRMDANKALRGEAPTKLSKRKKAEVDSYAEDARVMAEQQLQMFAVFETAQSLIRGLKPALDGDVQFWSTIHGKAHVADAPLVQQFSQAKARLRDAMADYLATIRRDAPSPESNHDD